MTKDWDPLRDEIQQLYHVENRKLTEVMRIIHGRHDFKASSVIDTGHSLTDSR